MVRFFVDFSALDNVGCLEEAGNLENQVVHSETDKLDISDNADDDSDNEEDSQSDCEDDDSSDSEEVSPHLDTSRKFEEIIMKNENAFLRLEKERLEKDQLINELARKVKVALTQGSMKMGRVHKRPRTVEQEKDNNQIYSMYEEMQILKRKIIEKAKVTDSQMKEREEKDQKLIILENTVVVLEMEKETLHRDLQQREDGRIEMQVRITKLNEDLQSLRKENRRKRHLESLKRESEQKTSKISYLEDELQVLVDEKQMAQENVKQLHKCKAELAEKKKELENLKEENLQKDRELLRLENECTLKQMEVIRLQKASQTVFVAEKKPPDGKWKAERNDKKESST
ncbi:uncharacterized protein LOC135224270 [Macrobrachium nipponense]|uniref:uncharacterized protein LOC135224270 n=1 Tax=Macrobrachium nipponense TaxID=159736 RepID=UPI0030C84C1B